MALREKLQQSAFKTGALTAETGARTGAGTGAMHSILQQIYAVKPDSISKMVDANGEPQVLYHGTSASFDTFSDWRPAFFTADRRYASAYGDDIMEAYLAIKRPFDPPTDELARTIYNEEFLPEVADIGAKPLQPGQRVPFTYADEFFGFLYEKEHTQGFRTYDGLIVDEGSIEGEYSKGRGVFVSLAEVRGTICQATRPSRWPNAMPTLHPRISELPWNGWIVRHTSVTRLFFIKG